MCGGRVGAEVCPLAFACLLACGNNSSFSQARRMCCVHPESHWRGKVFVAYGRSGLGVVIA